MQRIFEQAALRELFEETGLTRKTTGPQIASRTFPMIPPSGENVIAEERFFIINADKSRYRLLWLESQRKRSHSRSLLVDLRRA